MFMLAVTLAIVLPTADTSFGIRVVDDATGRGVPLVELRTVNEIVYVTDSAGWAAIDDASLMNSQAFFYVKSHGYEFPKDGFGIAGRILDVRPGGRAVLKIKRKNIAARLYRVVGAGIYRDSMLLGEIPPIEKPLLNAGVLGSDSTVNFVHEGKLHWFWGDTNFAKYPLGNFHVPGAVSDWPSAGGLDPDVGVNLKYFLAGDGRAKETAKLSGEGPTWIFGATVLPDKQSRETPLVGYVKVRPPFEVYERGTARWNDAESRFEKVTAFPKNAPMHPTGHTFRHAVRGKEYVYFCQPTPLFRVPATAEAYSDSAQYQAFTCASKNSTVEEPRIEREDGLPEYGWKANAPFAESANLLKWVNAGVLSKDEVLLGFRDIDSGKQIYAHYGSTYWNAHRQRWVCIFCEQFGSSMLGETWYAEADSPVGPWAYARKIVTHDNYSFYNPKQHPYFAKDNGRIVYFEGTYTTSFSSSPVRTPRYEYTQIMYKLDLDAERLRLPVAYYRGVSSFSPFEHIATPNGASVGPPAFFAYDRRAPGLVPITAEIDESGVRLVERRDPNQAVFWALDAKSGDSETTVSLWEEIDDQGVRHYTTNETPTQGWWRGQPPICRVWKNPLAKLPVFTAAYARRDRESVVAPRTSRSGK